MSRPHYYTSWLLVTRFDKVAVLSCRVDVTHRHAESVESQRVGTGSYACHPVDVAVPAPRKPRLCCDRAYVCVLAARRADAGDT